ncbi:hypothetical protein Gotur_025924, partial [Gossypium turneri]
MDFNAEAKEEFGFSRNYFLAKEMGSSGKKSARKLNQVILGYNRETKVTKKVHIDGILGNRDSKLGKSSIPRRRQWVKRRETWLVILGVILHAPDLEGNFRAPFLRNVIKNQSRSLGSISCSASNGVKAWTAQDKGEMMSMIYNWPAQKVDMIVLTDGSRILGLGDLGVHGIGIPIGKLDMYVDAAGLNPQRTVFENSLMQHHVALPPDAMGKITYIAPPGQYSLKYTVLELEFQGVKKQFTKLQ